MKLVVVESPAKCRTIKKCLGDGYVVEATMGHLRDLPQREMGIDVENGFEPKYVTIRGRGGVIKKLRSEAKKAEEVFLALDMDREGEAIAWHVANLLGVPEEKLRRVVFGEITPRAIREAFRHPGSIDMNKVYAQQARRLLDRIVGYELSPLLWKKVAKGLSAGRVQSVAVRLIVEREKEIESFVPREYWEVDVLFGVASGDGVFHASLERVDGEKMNISSEEEAVRIVEEMKRENFSVKEVKKKRTPVKPPPPFTTSLLQQVASSRLRFSASRTMRIAQQLYEGVDVGEEGPVGLITYMRTDSFRIAESAREEARDFIRERFGDDYVPRKPNVYASRRGAQEAHEAIRPTSVLRTPESVERYLTKEQNALYRLIWERFVASQMSPAQYDVTSIKIEGGRFLLGARARVCVFDGYTVLAGEKDTEEEDLPPLEEGDALVPREITPRQCFTKPPARYTEASLVRTLEREGIGRPSTYAQIISTIQERGYVELRDRQFYATELGRLVTEKLVAHFPDIMDVKFTAAMEGKLDEIEENRRNWVSVLEEFYRKFHADLEKAKEEMSSEKGRKEETGKKCPECGEPLVYRWGRRGKFLGCSGFPGCRYTESLDADEEKRLVESLPEEWRKCDLCGREMVVKYSRNGRFLACSGYPECTGSKPMPTGVKCPRCGGMMVEATRRGGRGRYYRCSNYPDCRYTSRKLPEDAGGEG